TGDPPGGHPTARLVVQVRGERGRSAEIRLEVGPPEPARLAVSGPEGSLTWEHDIGLRGPSRLIRREAGEEDVVTRIDAWDPKESILHALTEAIAGREVHPDLRDGTRAMEVSSAAARSLRRGRTVDLIYEEISEASNFKSIMTSTGCMLIVGAVFLFALS